MEEEEIVPKILLSESDQPDGFLSPNQKSPVDSDMDSQGMAQSIVKSTGYWLYLSLKSRKILYS